jgi:hypothetical protein
MNETAARNLFRIGLAVVAACAVLMWLPVILPAGTEIEFSDAIASTVAIGIGLILLSQVGPLIKSLKAGGIEIEFLDSMNDKFLTLEGKVAALELKLSQSEGRSEAAAPAKASARKPAPALKRPITERDDPQKGRFGGLAERDGFKLSASFRNATRNFVQIILRVETPESEELQELECVEFHLHDSFDPDVVPVIVHGNAAELSLLAYGGFTVGVWIPCANVELELDLSKVKGAPRMIRED